MQLRSLVPYRHYPHRDIHFRLSGTKNVGDVALNTSKQDLAVTISRTTSCLVLFAYTARVDLGSVLRQDHRYFHRYKLFTCAGSIGVRADRAAMGALRLHPRSSSPTVPPLGAADDTEYTKEQGIGGGGITCLAVPSWALPRTSRLSDQFQSNPKYFHKKKVSTQKK